ncbi:UNVERIFIED_CONTAM: hypothetical protein Sindi_0358600 [Sesamum indicum]
MGSWITLKELKRKRRKRKSRKEKRRRRSHHHSDDDSSDDSADLRHKGGAGRHIQTLIPTSVLQMIREW